MRTLFVLAGLALTTPALAAGPFGEVRVGNWRGGAFTNNTSGNFSHCVVSANYRSGVTLLVSVTSNFSWNLGFSNKHWQLKVGQNIPLELTFDRNAKLRVSGRAVQPNLIVVTMPPESALVRDFRGGEMMELFALGGRYNFRLTSTSQVMPTLVDCVRQNQNLHVAPGTRPPAGSAPVTASAPPANDGVLHLEAVTLATNFLLASQLPEPRVLNRSEIAPTLAANGTAWRAAGATGTVRVVRPTAGNQSAVDVAAIIVGNDAKLCKGSFASGRTSEMIDSEVMVRGFSTCDDSGGQRYAEYYVVPRKVGGFAVFSVQAGADGGRPAAIVEEKRATFQKAAMQAAR